MNQNIHLKKQMMCVRRKPATIHGIENLVAVEMKLFADFISLYSIYKYRYMCVVYGIQIHKELEIEYRYNS